jgi:DNA-binding NtrC family response regulator
LERPIKVVGKLIIKIEFGTRCAILGFMGKRVLVVDDEASVCEVLTEFLGLKGFEVTTMTNSASAMDVIDRTTPDLVILDLLMPEIDGLDLLAMVKRKHPEMPVIILTGVGYDVEIMKAAQDLGAEGFVSKGLFLGQLLMEMNRVLKHPASQPAGL